MYFNDIQKRIDAFSLALFVVNEIHIELNPIAAFFLADQSNFQYVFSYNKGCNTMKGLILKKMKTIVFEKK